MDDLKDRDAEGARLAAASLGGGEHVAAAQDEGDSLRLHGVGRSQPCSSATRMSSGHTPSSSNTDMSSATRQVPPRARESGGNEADDVHDDATTRCCCSYFTCCDSSI